MSRRCGSRLARSAADPLDDERRLGRAAENSAEQTYRTNGRSAGRPTCAQNSARSRDGCRSNHWSKHCAPVTTMRSAGTPCRLTRLLALDVVPDEHAIGPVADERLARQVIPAPHAQRRGMPSASRGAKVVDLRRAEIDERGDEHDVRPLRGDELTDRRVLRTRARASGRPDE